MPAQNGVYITSTGIWRRAPDFRNTGDVLEGTQVRVTDGATASGVYVVTSADPVVIGTSSITFASDNALDAGAATETVAGLLEIATTAEVATGTDDARAVTPLKLAQRAYLRSNTEDQGPVTGGASVTPKNQGTITTGTLTIDPGDRSMHYLTANGAFTWAPGSVKGTWVAEVTNGASAGTISTGGWTKVVGAFTTTSGHKFIVTGIVHQTYSLLTIQPLQ